MHSPSASEDKILPLRGTALWRPIDLGAVSIVCLNSIAQKVVLLDQLMSYGIVV